MTKQQRIKKRLIFWCLFAGAMLVSRLFFQAFPAWTETLYSRGIFLGIRWVFDVGLGWFPFPASYLLFGVLFWFLVKGLYFLIFDQKIAFKQRILRVGANLLAFVLGTVGLFYALWGFNYNRIPIEDQLGLAEITLTKSDIQMALEAQTKLVLDLRKAIQPDSSLLIVEAPPDASLEVSVRQAVQSQLDVLGFPTMSSPRGRQPFWDGFLMRFGAAGIYNPFTGECNIDQGLHFLTKPYNLAHEFGHGYGFGDEGTCNFLAYIALVQSPQIRLRYAAEFDFWRELAGHYRRLEPDTYAIFRRSLPLGFIGDLEAIYKKHDQYPEFFEVFRYEAYNQFLKAQGISEGMQNYGKVVPLVLAYRKK